MNKAKVTNLFEQIASTRDQECYYLPIEKKSVEKTEKVEPNFKQTLMTDNEGG